MQTKTPHLNTQRDYTSWWAYEDDDTLTPQPGAPPLDPNTTALFHAASAAATQVGAPETWTPIYLVKNKVVPNAKGEEKRPGPRPLHPPFKLDRAGETAHDGWAAHYIIPHTTTHKNDAAKITVTLYLPHTTKVYELTAPNVVITQQPAERAVHHTGGRDRRDHPVHMGNTGRPPAPHPPSFPLFP